jgi:hypothetical protein
MKHGSRAWRCAYDAPVRLRLRAVPGLGVRHIGGHDEQGLIGQYLDDSA